MSQNATNDSGSFDRFGIKLEYSYPTFRRLVVMFDGTGNTRQNMTNVSRMFEAIDDSQPESYKPINGSEVKDCPPFQGLDSTEFVQCKTCNPHMPEPAKYEGKDSKPKSFHGVPCGSCHQVVVKPALQPVQLVKYMQGVGTKLIRWLSANTLGYGLSEKVKEGYTWLCNNYQEGDEVFVFGFSRGAFSARSLVSLLQKCDGVLKKTPKSGGRPLTFDRSNKEDNAAIESVWTIYQAFVDITDPVGTVHEDKRNDYKRQKKAFDEKLTVWNDSKKRDYTIERLHVPVKMLGVWDTVGALGVDVTGHSIIDNRFFSRAQYQFHDQRLPRNVQNAYHALALDERREAFQPTLWTSRSSEDQEVKQVWFVGSHCNVGGGADVDDNDDPDDLWQYSYVWMQRHAEKHGLRFFWSYDSPATRQANSLLRTRRVSLRETEPSLENFVFGAYNLYKRATSVTPFIRETIPELAMLHWSVVERIKVTKADLEQAQENHQVKQMSKVYRPPTLFKKSTDDQFSATIPKGSPSQIELYQVDAKGEVRPATWYIETDDVWPCTTNWRLPDDDKKVKQPVGEGNGKKMENVVKKDK